MVEPLPFPSKGPLRFVSGAGLDQWDLNQAQVAEDEAAKAEEQVEIQLASYIRTQFEQMRNHRSSQAGWNERLLHAQRVFNGQYDASKLAAIKQFAGSEVYARVIAVKCRGASSLLRDVYLGPEKPWGLDPTPEPTLPDSITESVTQLVQLEIQQLSQMGQPVDPMQIRDRTKDLMKAAVRAAKKNAKEEAKKAEDKLDDMLVEGGFYKAIAEFITDLPLFPFAALKGPVVRVVPTVRWEGGRAVTKNTPRLFWSRVSPFDLYFTPGVSDIEDASIIERVRLTRADLNDVLDLPGYNSDAIRAVLRDYGQGGLRDWLDPTDSERAVNESREDPTMNNSGIIDCLEFHGNVQGSALLEWGMDAAQVPDPDRDLFVQAWLVGRHVIKVQVAPSPRKRHPYYITSFEKVPGTPVGNALPDILDDIQDVCNAALRSLVNNLSISSGPQVVINDDRIAPGADGQTLYPWKRWHVSNDPMSTNAGSQQPVYFFQPQSNALEMLQIYEKFTQIADELSAIPRYVTGSDRMGGAGRTASGLAMLMGNASKILQTVAANIDRDVIQPCLQGLYDMVMLTDESGLFRGDESIRVRGVDVAVQRETDRARTIELLQATMNPIDMEIIGLEGRANMLRSLTDDLNMDGVKIVPDEDEIKAKQEAMQVAAMQAQAMGGAPGAEQEGEPGAPEPVGQVPAEKPSNQDLGVQEGQNTRGIGGSFAAGGSVKPARWNIVHDESGRPVAFEPGE